jgi:rhodanese-related sulfurtransferase
VNYLGWLYRWGAPLTLIGDDKQQIVDARRELVRIGVDNVTGSAVGDVAQLSDGEPLRSYRVADFGELAEVLGRNDLVVLDVRQQREHDDSHIPGAVCIPLHEFADRMSEVPDGEVWVHCGSGYRASIAASMLDREHRTVVLVDDSFDTAQELKLAA